MAELLRVELTSPSGEPLRVEWDEGALAALREPGGELKPAWRLGGELDWDEVEAVRVLSARLDDGRVLAVAGLRPAGAAGHGEEAVAGALGFAGALESLNAVLLSTEYGADGLPQRVGLELHADEDAPPLRGGGDVTEASAVTEGGVHHVRAGLRLRLDGTGGAGIYEILTPA